MIAFRQPVRAICRQVPATFDRALSQSAPAAPIRVGVAQAQHAAYVQALKWLDVAVELLPAEPSFPDCCFVEDCAVCVNGVGLITRPGAATRRGEELAVAAALRRHLRLESMQAPATLDGGDCLRLAKRIFVGRSERTNAAGIKRLREVFGALGYEIIEIALGEVLHLKCVCSPLDDARILLAEGSIPHNVFGDVRIISVPADESYAANCLCINGTALVPAGFSAARRALESAAIKVIELDMSEIRKADGSMTCLSILI